MDDELLRDLIYRHKIASERFGKKLSDDLVRLLNTSDRDLVAQITSRYALIANSGFDKGPATTKRLEDMLAATRAVNSAVYEQFGDKARDTLNEVAGVEKDFAAGAARKAGVSFTARLPDASFLKTLVEQSPIPYNEHGASVLDPWLRSLEAGRIERIEGALRLGILQGETTDKLVARIAGTKAAGYTDGLLNVSRQSAATFAITANSTVANAARLETFKAMKTIGFLEWSSILDSRTSQICQSLSGKVFAIDSAHPSPPAHPRCRSILLPRRNNTDDPKHRPFGDWLKDQPHDVQDEVLGKARAAIFRDNPKIDFAEFFRKDGSYKTLDQLRDFDKRILSDKPVEAAQPKPEQVRFTSPVNPNVRADTIKVQSRKAINSDLTAGLTSAKNDSRYDPRPEYRGIKETDIGKSALSSAFTDAAASMIEALYPELDKMADAFSIPRLRAIRTGNGNFIATMGDGVLTLNPTYFNGYAAEVGGEVGESAAAKVIRERDRLAEQLKTMREDLTARRTKLQSLTGAEREAFVHEYLDAADNFNALRNQWLKLDKQVLKAKRTDNAASKPVATWKAGDDTASRPYTTTDYFSSIDRARSVMYHEFGHHVHQMTGKTVRRALATPPVEKELKRLFFNKFHGAAPGNLGGAGLERKKLVASTYGTTNEHEWFAENFSLYMMGRHDLVEPEIKELIERLLEEARGTA